MGVRLLHTADLHLDAEFRHSPYAGEAYRRRLRQAFSRVIDLACDGHDLLLIAGDLFDSNRPLAATVDFVRRELERAALPVGLLAGNHDHLDDESVYVRTAWPPNVHVFQTRAEQWLTPGLDLAVTGFPLSERPGECRQPEAPPLTRPARYHVAAFHGWASSSASGLSASHLQLQALRPENVDYIAMGHLHDAGPIALSVPAWYSGSPEPVQVPKAEFGVALSVELEAGGPRVTPVQVGTLRHTALELDIHGLDQPAWDLRLASLRDPHLILTVNLVGVRSSGGDRTAEALQERSRSGFFSLRVRDRTQAGLNLDEIPDSERTPLVREFANLMTERLHQAESREDREILQQALETGLLELRGLRTV